MPKLKENIAPIITQIQQQQQQRSSLQAKTTMPPTITTTPPPPTTTTSNPMTVVVVATKNNEIKIANITHILTPTTTTNPIFSTTNSNATTTTTTTTTNYNNYNNNNKINKKFILTETVKNNPFFINSLKQTNNLSSKSLDSTDNDAADDNNDDPLFNYNINNDDKPIKIRFGGKKRYSTICGLQQTKTVVLTTQMQTLNEQNNINEYFNNNNNNNSNNNDLDTNASNIISNNNNNNNNNSNSNSLADPILTNFIVPSKISILHEDDLSNINVKRLKKNFLMDQQVSTNNNNNNWKPLKENSKRILTIRRSISVKNLCRSFEDLTSINASNSISNDGNSDYDKNSSNLKRAKSVGDIHKNELTRHLQTIGVSVRALRDCYCSLVGLSESATNIIIINNNSNSFKKKKSSFNKFDALQKKNIFHIRSSDAGKAQEKFNTQDGINIETETKCKFCDKVVYKMEEIKAEKCVWHKTCFKCKECAKLLTLETYQSHESVLYCKAHFKLLLAPKAVENAEPIMPKKPELIIRENQPVELPPDVVRASDKPDLGLEELQQMNVKSKFQVFQNFQEQKREILDNSADRGVKRSASILSKLARFEGKAKNSSSGVEGDEDTTNGITLELSDNETDDSDNFVNDENGGGDDVDPDLVRAKRAQRERPMRFDQMNDIKTKFEKGHMSKEERREERKQEIQNIRSRLFMGKQAKIKEQYQQAVADSEQSITSAGKKPEIDIGDKAKSLKEKFEKGEIFRDDETQSRVQDEEMAVFESGIGKQSRSLFMELDASACKSPQQLSHSTTPKTPESKKFTQLFNGENLVKCDEKTDDIKIETSDISSKFKFFETYKPDDNIRKKEFRITPPREGVVKIPTPDSYDNIEEIKKNTEDPTAAAAANEHTATKMLNRFRELEQQNRSDNGVGLKPLKRFTPPPDDRRIYSNDSDDDGGDDDDEDGREEYEEEGEEEEEFEDDHPIQRYDDEYLKAAQQAARAKQLRAKFEKWEENEIKREQSNGCINVYDNSDESQVESARSLRAKFESMKDSTNYSPAKPQVQVNRFV